MKKGQVRITETVAVIFIFFILVAFGLMFYYKYQAGSLEQEQQELFDRSVVEKVNQILFLPELACTKGAAELDNFCFEILKLENIQSITQQEGDDYYFQMLGYASIKVTQIYPAPDEGQKPWVIYEWTKPNEQSVKPEIHVSPFIIALRDHRQGEDAFKLGLLEIGVFK